MSPFVYRFWQYHDLELFFCPKYSRCFYGWNHLCESNGSCQFLWVQIPLGHASIHIFSISVLWISDGILTQSATAKKNCGFALGLRTSIVGLFVSTLLFFS